MRASIVILLMISLLCSGCGGKEEEKSGASIQSSDHPSKKIMVIMVDSMTSDLINLGIEEGRTPAIAFLKEHGKVFDDFISPFPSMSVVIESSLITGVGPEEHHVPGLIWFNKDENRLVDYGSTIPRTFKLGTKQILEDGLKHLNNTHLNQELPTIYDEAKNKGLTTGSVNMLLYKGPIQHTLSIPPLVKHAIHTPSSITTKGPDLLAFGQLAKPDAIKNKNLPDHMYEQYGINDQYSTEVIQTLIQSGQQPDFLMTFLPDFDKEAHIHGPHDLEGFAKADYHLQTILNSYPSWEEAIDDTIFILLGDHSQVALKDKGEHTAIELEALLEPYSIANLLDEPTDGDLILANNHRMAYIHLATKNLTKQDIIDLLYDERIDQLAWADGEEIIVKQAESDAWLSYKKNGDLRDQYNQTWDITGDLSVLDLSIDKNSNSLDYGKYPDALEQLYSALKSQAGSLIITAKPGYTLKTEGAPVHYDGGEHGGLHEDDTKAALIVTGTDIYPDRHRIRDLKHYFLQLLNQKESLVE
ncbi:alkaline phosphatase family protein [Alkalihalophilus pseudofirmus]|uniref:alkaline phosphatase family protein n=1 Tax=Alkalihalophilus pseudofirmus TaxID=79885 RepID=UPI00259B6F61|nr:alkaline phosphatase family protein [Alkalihalophilus pseudofirmus]WEG18245.1 alkaline phosphatase family protein [Alkalihalophilus pseudofirmus]